MKKILIAVTLIIFAIFIASCSTKPNKKSLEINNSSQLGSQAHVKGNIFFKDTNGNILIDKTDITSAKEKYYKNNSWQYVIELTFNEKGSNNLAKVTKTLILQQINVYVDNTLISSPTIDAQITDGDLIIAGGDFSKAQADKYCSEIN